jgi:hypothetical protein
MKRVLPAIVFVLGVVACSVVGCSTGNGDDVHGPTFGPFPEREGGSDGGGTGDAATDDASDDADGGAGCATGTVAVLAGGSTTLTASVQERSGAWSSTTLGTATVKSKPALAAFGTGFLGVVHDTTDALATVRYTTSWSAPAALGMAGVKGGPSLSVAGTSAHLVYSAGGGADRFFWSGVHDGSNWDAAGTRVSSDGTQANQSFGTISAGLAAVGSDVVFAENGTNEKLYVRPFSGTWGASKQVADVDTQGGALETTPELVAHDGAFDLAVIYVRKTTRQLAYATRAVASNPNKDWVDGGIFHALATTAEKFSVARISPTTMLVAFRGQDGNGYYATGTISGTTIAWTAAQAVGGAVSSTPAVARGVCGDDAIVAFAQGGAVRATRLRGTTWTAPETIAGAAGSFVAVATR